MIPFGLLSPFIVRAKILLQELWSKGLNWDDSIDADIYSRVKIWFEEIEVIQTITVPRCLQSSSDVKSTMIVTFVDASKDTKVQVGNSTMVRPITKLAPVEIESKTKVL